MKKEKKNEELENDHSINCIKIPGFEGMPIATDTMLCPNCKSVIGCFAGPPPVCPNCGKSTFGLLPWGVFFCRKLFKKKK